MESFRIFLDTDVLINWLAKETDPNTGFNLWRCPYAIIELIERREIVGHTSLTNIFEVRFVLRRKKKYSEKKIKDCIETLFGAIEIEVPDSGDMLEANRLQNTPEEFLERYFPNIFVRIKDAIRDILKER
ncbi:MAG: hypothetical protein KAU16_06445 [Methanophagales archaeon]|nr:hypothetical protein [Methanophagales archaeon]